MLGVAARRFAVFGGVAIVGAAVAGVLTAHLETAEAIPARPQLGRLAALIPPYPEVVMVPMGRGLHVSGVEREMAYGVTADAPARVAERYEAIWESQGYDVQRYATEVEETVAARAENDPWVRVVVASRSMGRTTIIASLSAADAHGTRPRIPIPDHCNVRSHTGGLDMGVDTQMATLDCEGYARQVLDFYDAALHGTTRKDHLESGAGEGGAFVSYSGAEREVMLTVKQAPTDPPHTVASISWQERR